MPKKRPLPPAAIARLTRRANDARSQLLLFRSVAATHFVQRHEIRRRTERLLKEFDLLLEELKSVKAKQSG
jgi:hypothetical protein